MDLVLIFLFPEDVISVPFRCWIDRHICSPPTARHHSVLHHTLDFLLFVILCHVNKLELAAWFLVLLVNLHGLVGFLASFRDQNGLRLFILVEWN